MKGRALLSLALCIALAGCADEPSDSVLPGVSALVFVKRAYIEKDGTHNVAGGNNQTIDYLRYTPGGGLFVLEPPKPGGTLRNLTAGYDDVDVNGVDLSFDAKQVVFSMRRADDSNYHIYVANLDGGKVTQLTFGPYDDVKPIFVPGGRIAFVTNQPYTEMGTRADEYNHSRVVTQLATISATTGDSDRWVCSQNLSHSADPFLLSDGRIGFSRWEHLGPINDVKLFAMRPDCTQMVALAGQHGKPGNSLVQMQEVEEGVFVGITTSRERTIQAGSLVQVDARARAGASGIRFDEQHAEMKVLTPLVPTNEASPPSRVGRYRQPFPLSMKSGTKFLVSWADGDVNDRNELSETAPKFGLYLFDPDTGQRTLVYDDPDMWDLYAIPVAPRATPPAIGTASRDAYTDAPAVIGSIDVTVTSLNESVSGGPWDGMSLSDALKQTHRVRVIEGFSSEIGPVREFGLTMHEGAAILDEVPVFSDGSWEVSVPPLLPYHLQPLDRFGLAIRNEMLWIQAMPGEQRRCGGCHEGRSDVVLPRNGTPTTLAQTAEPRMATLPIADRIELPWMGATSGTNVQDLFDAKCVSCHSGGAGDPFAGRTYTVQVTSEDGQTTTDYQIPWLDLSSRPIDTYYEMAVVTYPASYVSLLYPSAMMGDVTIVGEGPPMWVVPGAARESRLVSKVNSNAETDPNEWAWPTPAHPEDVGVELTREERLMLIRMADLGGQYWSRRNVEGSSQWGSMEY